MKLYLTILSFWILLAQTLALQVAVTPLIFKADQSAIVEFNYQVIGSTINFDTINGQSLQAAVDVTIIFKQDSAIVKFDKFRLNSPVFKYPTDFLDVRKYGLNAGAYSVYLEFTDSRDTANKVVYNEIIDVPDYKKEKTTFSSVKLLASIKKAEDENSSWVQHGLVMEPLPHNFYDKRQEQLAFYVELYGLPKIEKRPLVLKMEILSKNNDSWESVQTTYHKLDSYKDVEAFARKIDIRQLSSNIYMLALSLIDADKNEYERVEALFARSNPDKDKKLKEDLLADVNSNFFKDMTDEELEYNIRAIAQRAAASDQERINFLIANGTPQMRKDFLYGYWLDIDPLRPYRAYQDYMTLIRALDEKFYSAYGHGFETDRGRIYLKYGPPSQIVRRENDQSAKPYEIWTYDRIDFTNQTDVKFVFYNPTLGGNDFELLHSNCRNEIQNPKWLQYIYNVPDEFEGNPVDGRGVQDNFAREAERLYNDN